MKAGAFTPATHAGDRGEDVVHLRSMKAGAFTPATREIFLLTSEGITNAQ